jgi:phosphoribosylanthranilate isomerase
MVFAIHIGFSPLAWHSPVSSQRNSPKKTCMHTWIKICGTTCLEDALRSVEAGAAALGFIFSPSRRQVSPQKAQQIISKLPQTVERIGVFMNAGARQISGVVGEVDLTGVQMHGESDVPSEAYGCLPEHRRDALRKIKTILVEEGFENTFDILSAIPGVVDAWLFDAGAGGGKTFDWQAAKKQLGARAGRFALAGGLTPENVGEALRAFRPWGVDVVTGVEREPGRKDLQKLKTFVAAVRRAEEK